MAPAPLAKPVVARSTPLAAAAAGLAPPGADPQDEAVLLERHGTHEQGDDAEQSAE